VLTISVGGSRDVSLSPSLSPDIADPMPDAVTAVVTYVFPHQDGVVQCGDQVVNCYFHYFDVYANVNQRRDFASLTVKRFLGGYTYMGHDSALIAGGRVDEYCEKCSFPSDIQLATYIFTYKYNRGYSTSRHIRVLRSGNEILDFWPELPGRSLLNGSVLDGS